MTSGDLVSYALDADEVAVLAQGLSQWGGPGRPTEELALALGWASLQEMRDGGWNLKKAIERGDALTALAWTKALAMTEIAFVSDVFGAGYEWRTVTGLDDNATLQILRRLQVKMVGSFGPAVGTSLGTCS